MSKPILIAEKTVSGHFITVMLTVFMTLLITVEWIKCFLKLRLKQRHIKLSTLYQPPCLLVPMSRSSNSVLPRPTISIWQLGPTRTLMAVRKNIYDIPGRNGVLLNLTSCITFARLPFRTDLTYSPVIYTVVSLYQFKQGIAQKS